MPKRDPYETLRQKLSFAEEARMLGSNGSRARLVQDLGYGAEWSQIPWIQIIGMRNGLIHGYDGIDVETFGTSLTSGLGN
jgi:nitrogenase molybdenum-iron protein alpha/beta subunit